MCGGPWCPNTLSEKLKYLEALYMWVGFGDWWFSPLCDWAGPSNFIRETLKLSFYIDISFGLVSFLREEFSSFLGGERESHGQFSLRWVGLGDVNIQFVYFYCVSLFSVRQLTPLFSRVWYPRPHRFSGSTSPQWASFPVLCCGSCNLLALWLGELHFNSSLYKLPTNSSYSQFYPARLPPDVCKLSGFLCGELTDFWLSALQA